MEIDRCSTRRCSVKSCSAKGVQQQNFLQWSKSSSEAFISITDLINYRKHSQKIKGELHLSLKIFIIIDYSF